MPLLPGVRLGSYEILVRIGAGGMGEVHRARDTRLNRDVAVKVLPERLARDPERLARFHREAQLLAALNHPNIAHVYGFESAGDLHALVMELIDGATLAETLAAGGALPADEALAIARQLVDALDAAHRRRIVHRDIKPANIKVTPDGTVKVLDFGLAKGGSAGGAGDVRAARGADDDPTLTFDGTRAGVVLGTTAYMSPEQTRGRLVDSRTDIWAFGCVLYELLTGGRAFAGETTSDTIAAILTQEPDWRRLPATTPLEVTTLLRRCLEKNADQRLRDIADARPALQASGTARAAVTRHAADAAIASLVVLPFVNDSGDPQMEYLSDGLTESITLSLSRLPQLRIIARTTAFRYKGRIDDVQQIGRTLGVGAVVTGRVLQRGGMLVVGAELVDVTNGWQLWGAQYRRSAADIFATEEQIANEISSGLRLTLTPDNKELLRKRYTENVNAYHLYLKGKFHWAKRTAEGLSTSIRYFREALELDPTYALAYAGLAEGYVPMAFYGHRRPADVLPQARAAAEQALALDPTLSEARTVVAASRWILDFAFAPAEQELRGVIHDDPNYPRARQTLSEILTATGRVEEALAEARRALALDPLSLAMNAHVALTLYFGRMYDAAADQARKTLDMDPHFYPAHWALGLAREQQRRFAEAIDSLDRAVSLSGRSTFMIATLAAVHAAAGASDRALQALGLLDELAARTYISPVLTAQIHAALGDSDRALAWLDRALEEADPKLMYLNVDPRFDTLRGEPRLRDIGRRLHLDREWR